ncbi:Glycogen accumulation regulator GarA [Caulifigura coniformis]|uniref:Glycogen accumulation regulator GarA n=1 Tax=Caulifigura coniformis TaxID=2527983 RepID=A0A517SJ40_9PLAN|nr:FHA domain-containing protein [Caulifigura coniformis]QDT56148.1 Glycogen accumulation regulator GarA [Caulifigura coniformis]
MPMCLIPMDGSTPVPVDKAVVLFGRQADCDVVLLNSRKVSRRHCCIAQINGEFVIRDLGSMNGVRVNGKQVNKEARLGIGDEIHIGDVGYRLAAVDALPKRKPAPVPPPPQKPLVTPDPRYLSQDIPVALPDEQVNFAVEETAPKLKAVPRPAPKAKAKPKKPGSVFELSEDDIVDD